MKNTSLAESLSELKEVVIEYLDARIGLAKAILLEKLSKIGTYFLTAMAIIIVIASMLMLLIFAFSFWYGNYYGNIYQGFMISAGFYLLVGIVIFIFRRTIFSNNIIRNVGRILFTEENDD
jgi:hypothetical protein